MNQISEASSTLEQSSWFFANGKQKLGPFSWETLQGMARDGQIQPTDMVLRNGTQKWVRADSVAGIFTNAILVPQAESRPAVTTSVKRLPFSPRRIAYSFAGVATAVALVGAILLFATGNTGRPIENAGVTNSPKLNKAKADNPASVDSVPKEEKSDNPERAEPIPKKGKTDGPAFTETDANKGSTDDPKVAMHPKVTPASTPKETVIPKTPIRNTDNFPRIVGILRKARMAADGIDNEYDRKGAQGDVAIVQALTQANAKDFAGALRIADDIKVDYQKALAYRKIAGAQAKWDFAGAVSTAALLGNDGDQLSCFAEMTKTFADRLVKAPVTAEHRIAGNALFEEWVKSTLRFAETVDKNSHGWMFNLGEIAEAQAIAGDMTGTRRTIEFMRKHTQPGSDWMYVNVAMRRIAGIQAARGDLDGAFQMVNLVSNPLVREYGVVEAAKESIKAENLDNANRCLGSALLKSDAMKSLVLSSLAEHQAKAGQKIQAQKTLADANRAATGKLHGGYDINTRRGIEAYALRSFAIAQGSVGDIDGALKTANSITDTRLRIDALASVGVLQIQRHELSAARITFDEAVRVAATSEGASGRFGSLTRLASAQAEAGDLDGVLAWANKLEQLQQKCYALVAVADALLQQVDDEPGLPLDTKKQPQPEMPKNDAVAERRIAELLKDPVYGELNRFIYDLRKNSSSPSALELEIRRSNAICAATKTSPAKMLERMKAAAGRLR